MSARLATVEELLDELRGGRPVIVVDDEDRENEGDLIVAAEHISTEQLAFTIRHTGGVVCLAMPNDMADRLDLPPMVTHNTARRSTAFTVSIEAREGVDTGISAKDRATTIRTATSVGASAEDLSRPGHVFPLRARDGGVLRRAGHTEAAVDLCRLAGLRPAAALSELMHDDGSMMRLPAILDFAAEHGLKVGTIASLIAYRLERDLNHLRRGNSRCVLVGPARRYRSNCLRHDRRDEERLHSRAARQPCQRVPPDASTALVRLRFDSVHTSPIIWFRRRSRETACTARRPKLRTAASFPV